MPLYHKKVKEGVIVGNEFFEALHSLKVGGALNSLVFKKGTGKNLISKPLSSHFKFSNPSRSDQMYSDNHSYDEHLDKNATLDVSEGENGDVIVVSKGRYTRDNGETLNATYKRTTIYNEFGLMKSYLDATAEKPIEKVVEFTAAEISLREGMNKAFIKHHPKIHQAMEFQGAGWLDLPKQSYTARYIPSYVAVVEQNVEGLEMFPGSDYFEWDRLAGEVKGIAWVAGGGKSETTISLNPHCYAFYRIGIKYEGTHRFEINIGIPFVKNKREIFFKTFQAGAHSVWAKDYQIAEAARDGINLLRFHNDYRENGPFWHDGMYPPYDPAGMKELKRVITTAHKNNMKIIPYISLKEFHPESQGFKENFQDWKRMVCESGEVSNTYFYTGEFGALMCMKSGWLERRKQDVETILTDLPWDGLYFDWTTYHPCCNEKHAAGWHTDVNEFLEFVIWCRRRIGKKGFLFTHLSQVPSLIVENMSDMVVVGESSGFADPGKWDPEYYFLPITQKLCGKWGMTGKSAAFAAMSGMLEGFPLGTTLPMNKTEATVYREYRLFAGIDMNKFQLMKASENPVNTGTEGVWSNLYFSKDEALMYVANLTEEKKSAKLSVDLASYGLIGNFSVEVVRNESLEPVLKTGSKELTGKVTLKKSGNSKHAGSNVAPEPEAMSADNAIWTNNDVDNGKILREKFNSGVKDLKAGIDCELPPLMSALYRIKLQK